MTTHQSQASSGAGPPQQRALGCGNTGGAPSTRHPGREAGAWLSGPEPHWLVLLEGVGYDLGAAGVERKQDTQWLPLDSGRNVALLFTGVPSAVRPTLQY